MTENILQVNNLTKIYGDTKAVNNISFTVTKGSLFAFLGQNGAGKSTTINAIIGLLAINSGKITYGENKSFTDFKHEIGVVFQNNVLDDNLTVEENILTLGSLYIKKQYQAKKRTGELITLFNLEDIKKKFYKTLSGGQKRKCEIAVSLFNNPTLLFLDEPTTGLDPKTRKEVWAILRKIQKMNGLTIFLTTHYMEETAEADNVIIIHKGKKVCEGTPQELKAKYTSDYLLITPINAKKFETELKKQKLTFSETAGTYKIKISDAKALKSNTRAADRQIDLLYSCKDNIQYFEAIKGNMDDVFLNVVGEKAEEPE
jgi:multidrug/hemolysin transport system ATP-binding protein